MDKKKMKKDLWMEGRWIDFWTINHLLSGISAGSLLYLMGISLGWSFFIPSVLFLGWEIIEFVSKIESPINQIVDLVAAFLGYGIFYTFYYLLGKPFDPIVVFIIVLSFVILEGWEFYTWRLRVKDSQQLQN